ncbi:Bacteriocin-protection, YdeI or OmpD-Associated [Polaromonas sp. YR568]|uniref:YdeI/OmpD-associated family protein n=1 Tax=Polaromonas sp. YR568 TaxID=1855301 RepID=UPI0008E67362|nr:YdeI/OmpD-associated family protein [Polaromonas sp. YR568]SFV02364.1 Bacteriocin-protection, YdeI or OmpD-Associated [Polaromonas sp. YR568]
MSETPAQKPSGTKRERYAMPGFIQDALASQKLKAAYDARPPYQQNDYIGWITRAKLPATRDKRLAQMLAELHKGDVYMNMVWRAKP